MKTAAATLSLAALANAAAPESAFHFNRLLTGYAAACRGADTLDVKVTPESVAWDFQDFSGESTGTATYCVMENDIYRAPGNWRFAFESATYSGNVKLSGDTTVERLGTYLHMMASYVTNPPATHDTLEWALRAGPLGNFVAANTTLNPDESGNFEVVTKPDAEGWSPCFFKNSTTDYFKFQMGHQTMLYWNEGAEATGKSELGPGLKLTLKMKWEECDASLDAISKWGEAVKKPENWNPYT